MTQKQFSLLGMGNPLLDISAKVDQDFLTKYNLKSNDAILAEDRHLPMYSEMMDKFKSEFIAGGATQNAIRGAQWLLPPNSTVFIGCVGKDEYAKKLREAAEGDGVRVEYMETSEHQTGTCAVCITGHDRSMVANLSAANHYKVEDIKEKWNIVENADFFYIGGFFLTVSIETILKVAQHAAEKNKVFMMNLSAPFLPKFFKDQMDSASPYWDILFGNETEALAYAESHNISSTNIKEIAQHLANLPKINKNRSRIVIITQGGDPTIVVQDSKVLEFPVIPIKPEDIIDSNGAGDAFVGGFLSQYVQGKSLEKCIAGGNYVANIVIQRSGASYPKEKANFN